MKLDDRLNISRSRILDLWDKGHDTYDIAVMLGLGSSGEYIVANHLAHLTGETEPAPEKRRRSA